MSLKFIMKNLRSVWKDLEDYSKVAATEWATIISVTRQHMFEFFKNHDSEVVQKIITF